MEARYTPDTWRTSRTLTLGAPITEAYLVGDPAQVRGSNHTHYYHTFFVIVATSTRIRLSKALHMSIGTTHPYPGHYATTRFTSTSTLPRYFVVLKTIRLAVVVVMGTVKTMVKTVVTVVKKVLQLAKRIVTLLLGVAFAILLSPVLLPMRFFKVRSRTSDYTTNHFDFAFVALTYEFRHS